MSSVFPNDYFSTRSQRPLTGQLPELISDPTSQIINRLPVNSGKRSLAEFQAQNQQNQALSFYLRNVKARNNSPSILGYPVSRNSNFTPGLLNYPNLVHNQDNEMIMGNTNNVFNNLNLNLVSNSNSNNSSSRLHTQTLPNFYNYSNLVPNHNQNMMINTPSLFNYSNLVPNRNDKIKNKLQELEKHLLDDEDEAEDTDTGSVITNNEWSDTFRHLISPPPHSHSLSHSPTSSCSSCCSSSAPTLSPKQILLEAATAISDNKPDLAIEILTRLSQSACVNGTAEQRLARYFSEALKARVGTFREFEVYSEEHALSTEMLYEASPCFKLGFMAANLAILEAMSLETGTLSTKLHVVDFEIGRGGHYVHLIHALAARNNGTEEIQLKITVVTEYGETEKINRIRPIGDGLIALATKVGVSLAFEVLSLKVADLNLEKLGIDKEEKLAVNLPFKLYKLADESVTMENPRDELLRRVKGLSPIVVTVVEQEMNTNTAPFLACVNETCGYYGALFDSLDSIIARENPDRVKIEEGLGRKLANAVTCEGKDRVERCEVFGKWRARMGMAGFKPKPITGPIALSLMARLGSGTRCNPGFTVKEENGGILFGWMGRTLTVASAWH